MTLLMVVLLPFLAALLMHSTPLPPHHPVPDCTPGSGQVSNVPLHRTTCADTTSDGRLLVWGTAEHIIVFDLTTMHVVRSITQRCRQEAFYDLDVSPSGQWLAYGRAQYTDPKRNLYVGEVIIEDIVTGDVRTVMTVPAFALRWSPDEQTIALSTLPHWEASVWDSATGEVLRRTAQRGQYVGWYADSDHVTILSNTVSFLTWDWRRDVLDRHTVVKDLGLTNAPVQHPEFSFLVLSQGNHVVIWDAAKHRIHQSVGFARGKLTVLAAAPSPHGDVIAVATDRGLLLWTPAMGSHPASVTDLRHTTPPLTNVAWALDGSALVLVDNEGGIALYDMAARRLTHTIVLPQPRAS